IAISKPHKSVLEIAPAYSETMEVIEFNSLVGGVKDIVAFDYGNYDGISYNYSLEKERAFSKYLHMEDFEKAKEILNEILQIEISGGNQSMQLVKCRTFGLVSSMLNKIDLIITSVDVEFFERIDPINKLLNAKTVQELQVNTNFIFDSFNEYFKLKKGRIAPEWIEKAVQFIDSHYAEQDLNVSFIADHLQMNASYLSNTFKKYMGLSILDYIHKLRLSKAKELMNKGMNLNEIAREVGFTNVLTMHRIFKKFEGISPGKYKE
ncbi:MAG: helix-turn-helix transcriptional regulator, partial [Clostridiales bacterium]|nr:helix-turn-helix transcriptional regulator [Clostridiales bacterium]